MSLSLFEAVFAATASWPAVILLFTPSFRSVYRCFALAIASALAVYFAVLAVLLVHFPGGLHGVALLAAAFLVYERWRARDSFGRGIGLPPGSLAVAPFVVCRDDHFFFDRSRILGPVFKLGYFRPTVAVVGHRRILDLVRDAGGAMAHGREPHFSRRIPKGFLRYMAPNDHQPYRRLFQRAIAEDLVRVQARAIRGDLDDAIDRLAGAANGSRGIAIPDHARAMLEPVFARFFFGAVPGEDAAVDRIMARYPDLDIRRPPCLGRRREHRAHRAIIALVRARAEAFVANPATAPDCVLKRLLAEPGAATDDTVLGNLIYAVETGAADLAELFNWLARMLADHPHWLARVRADKGTPEVVPIALAVVRETLRLEQSEALDRRVAAAFTSGGYRFPEGWRLRLCLREGHRDPRVFADPDRFDPERFRARSYANEAYAPFGLTAHRCLGAVFVETVASAFVAALAARCDIAIAVDAPRIHGRFHWRPGPEFRVALRDLAG